MSNELRPLNEFLMDIYASENTESEEVDEFVVVIESSGKEFNFETYSMAERKFDQLSVGDERISLYKRIDGILELISFYPCI